MGQLGFAVGVEMGWRGETAPFYVLLQTNKLKKKYRSEGRILFLFLHVQRHFLFFFSSKKMSFFISNRRDNIFYIML